MRTELVPSRQWSWAHCLAVIAVPVLFWETWTIVAWLGDGPYQITEFRERNTLNWYAARAFEVLIILVSVFVIIYVVRGCLRERRVLTFDVMFCLAGATIFWADIGANFFNPVFLESSNWTNLNGPCGHMPFVVNPDCGRVPDAVLFNLLLTTFGLLGLAIIIGGGVRWMRSRWPGLSTRQSLGIVVLAGLAFDLVLEPLVALPLHLWNYPPMPMSISLGNGFHYPIIEMFAGGLFFGLLISIRIFKDDHGRSVVERGLDRHAPPARKAITLLALCSLFQLITWPVANGPLMLLGFYESRWPKQPAYIINNVCDAPGVHGTRYGPCPGSPSFHMPGRHSLPGKSP